MRVNLRHVGQESCTRGALLEPGQISRGQRPSAFVSRAALGGEDRVDHFVADSLFLMTQTNWILSWEAVPLNIQQKQRCAGG